MVLKSTNKKIMRTSQNKPIVTYISEAIKYDEKIMVIRYDAKGITNQFFLSSGRIKNENIKAIRGSKKNQIP